MLRRLWRTVGPETRPLLFGHMPRTPEETPAAAKGTKMNPSDLKAELVKMLHEVKAGRYPQDIHVKLAVIRLLLAVIEAENQSKKGD